MGNVLQACSGTQESPSIKVCHTTTHLCTNTRSFSLLSAMQALIVLPLRQVGDAIPSVNLHAGFLPRGGRTFNMATETATGKVVILGLPGAFTPC